MNDAGQFYDAALDMMGIVGFDGYFKDLNPAWERTLGHTSDELMAQPYLAFVHPDDVAATTAAAERLVAGESIIDFENRYRCKDGAYRWLSWNTKSEAARKLAYSVARDITAQKEMEQELQRFASMVATTEDLMTYIDRELIYRAANSAFLRYWQKSAADVIGRRWADVVGQDLLKSGIQQKLERCLAGETIRFQTWYTFASVGPRLLNVAYYPHYDGQPYPVGVVVISRDITEQHTSQVMFEQVAQSAMDGFWFCDLDGKLLDVNSALCDLLGYTRDELLALSIADIDAGETPDETAEHIQRIIRQGHDRFSTRHRRKDGQVIDVGISARFLDLGAGRLVVFSHDISARKLAERQREAWIKKIEQSNHNLQQFAYVASHDLQEPLRMVTNFLGLLERRYADKLDSEAREFIGFAVDGAKRMQSLIQGLLDYSRIETRGQELAPVDCQTALDSALFNLQIAIEESQAVITQDPLPVASVDETQLIQLFQNLIGNAIKFCTEAAPHIHIGVKRDGNEWQFAVRDNGIGIDPHYHTRIFDMFQQLHGRGEYAGTGIGLAICKKIVERHDGRLWLVSQPGEGATSFFTLPIRE